MTTRAAAAVARRYLAENGLRAAMGNCEGSLGEDRFSQVSECVKKLPPLASEVATSKRKGDADALAAARAEDRARVYFSIFVGVNTRSLRRAMLPADWCRDRDEALIGVGKAIRKLERVVDQNTADPGLLGLSIEGLAREYRRILREASPAEPLDADAYSGRASVGRTLLGGSPARLGWVRGGRPAAVWKHRTVAELRAIGVRGEALNELIEAAGLNEPTPDLKQPKRPRKPKAKASRTA